MADYRAVARAKARKYHIPEGVFVAQIQQESGFNPTISSPAGAQGIAQIMPATAKGWGVDPLNPEQALDAAARNMARYIKQFGSVEKALRAYNAGPGAVEKSRGYKETNNYVKTILGSAGHEGNSEVARETPGRSALPGVPGVAATQVGSFDQEGYQKAQNSALLAGLISKRRPQSTLLRLGLLSPEAPNIADFEGKQTIPGLPGVPARSAIPGSKSDVESWSIPGGGKFKIVGPNPGRIKKPVRQFAKRVSAVAGEPIVGSDGSTHSKYTVNGNVSDHYSGNATDIPAEGERLIRLGQAALIAAGMPPKQARKQKGGLYNVGGHQVIFNTQLGGDHTDHLHISAK